LIVAGTLAQAVGKITKEHLHRKTIRQLRDLRIFGEFIEFEIRELRAEFCKPFRRDHTFFDETFIVQKMAWKKISGGDLEIESFFEAENDIDEINGFGAQIPLQGSFRRNIRLIYAERAGQCLLNFRKEFFLHDHATVLPKLSKTLLMIAGS